MAQLGRRLGGLCAHLLPAQGERPRKATAAEHEAAAAVVINDAAQNWPDWCPTPVYTHVPRFSFDTVRGRGEAMAYLQQEGYVVLKDILSQSECSTALDMMWSEIEDGSSIDRADPSTWQDEQQFGNNWGHSDFLWYVRGISKVKKVWEVACRTDDLLVSFDGAALAKPWGIEPSWRTRAMGFHTDRRNHEGIPDGYIQGFVNLVTTSAASGGNVIVPRSHHKYQELQELVASQRTNQFSDKDFYQTVYAARPDVFDDNVITAHVEAGDVFLWLDTAIHCRAGGTGVGPTEPTLIRAAVYVTMSPKSLATAETLQQRKLAVELNAGNGHTAHHPIPQVEKGPNPNARKWGGAASLSPSTRKLIA